MVRSTGMSGMRTIAIGAGLALLAGCSVPEPEKGNEIATEKDDGFNVINPAGSNAPASRDADRPGLYGKIPGAFLGRWGLTPADCAPMSNDAKGLMTVEADRLNLSGSRASVAKIDAKSVNEVQVTFSFSGEGREWTEETPLVLEQDGNVLTRYAGGQALRYARCGA